MTAALFRAYAPDTSPLMEALLCGAADDLDAGGPAAGVLTPFLGDDPGSALPLRFAAALHRLVLERRAGLLATHYPSVGGTAPVDAVWAAAREVCAALPAAVVAYTALPCQTNEVGRTTALVRALAELGDGDVRVLEIGSSAGLQLWFDGFDYAGSWGRAGSPCVLPAPALVPSPGLRVVSTAGCDPNAIDPLSEEGRVRLTSSVWGDQLDRFERLRGALAVATQRGRPPVTCAPAGEWLAAALAEPFDGVTVVWHSVVQQYVPDAEWASIIAITEAAGARHAAYEPGSELGMELRLDDRVLAIGGPHDGVLTEV